MTTMYVGIGVVVKSVVYPQVAVENELLTFGTHAHRKRGKDMKIFIVVALLLGIFIVVALLLGIFILSNIDHNIVRILRELQKRRWLNE